MKFFDLFFPKKYVVEWHLYQSNEPKKGIKHYRFKGKAINYARNKFYKCLKGYVIVVDTSKNPFEHKFCNGYVCNEFMGVIIAKYLG